MTTYQEEVIVELCNDERGTLRLVPVIITYLVERDTDYGADADGRRGVTKEELYILDTAIHHHDVRHLTVDDVYAVAERAVSTITERTR